MKRRTNLMKCFGIIAFAAIIGFSLAGCEDPTSPPKKTLTGITAVYSGTGTVYLNTPLYSLKEGLAVTAQYSNKSSKPLESSAYNLSGTLVVGLSTVTVSYTEGSVTRTTTFTVNDVKGLSDLSGDVTIDPSENVTTGMELTAVYSGDETVSYQWKKDGVTVGANAKTFTPTEAGNYTVTVGAVGFNSKTSEPVEVTDPLLDTLSGTITIDPSENVTTGTELTAVYSGDEDVSYQWNRDNAAIDNETLGTYTPDEAGSYTVTVKADGYNSKTSEAVTVTGAALSDLPGDVTIDPSGEVTAGTKLTASYSGSEDVSYQWNRNNAAILDATSDEFTPEEAGSYTVTVRATGFRSKTSNAVTVKALDSISAEYDNAGTVYTTTPRDNLKNGLTVTAHYSDDTTVEVAASDYTLEGDLTEGTSTITVKYTENGVTKTATFDVSVLAPVEYAISLSPVTFPAADYGYGDQAEQTVIVENVGTKASGVLAVAITGQDFTLSTTTLTSVSVDDETFFNVTPKTGLNAGVYTATVTVSNSGNGISETIEVKFTVNKINLTVTWPTAAAITYGAALSTSALSGGAGAGAFAWTNGATIPTVSNSGYEVTFTPTDAVNYNKLTNHVSIIVSKANPTVTWPTNLMATTGQALSTIALPGNGTSTPAGTFTWETPTTTVGSSAPQSHNMIFTPTDTANYNTLTRSVGITLALRVSFNTNGGSSIADQMITTSGTAANRPTNPTRSSYRFDYWYTDAGFTTPYYFATPVTSNITLYAKWVLQTDITTMAGKDMVFVPGGSFEMGKNLGTAEGADVTPLHTVTLSGFWMGKYEVTQEKYQTVMGTNPSNWTNQITAGDVQNKRPVEQVSWYDALVFCNKLSTEEGLTPAYRINNSTDPTAWGTVPTSSDATWNAVTIVSGSTGYRLPTEAQWEYAAKGGDPAATGWVGYTFAGSDTVGSVAWHNSNNVGNGTHEVGKLAVNGLGLYDMSGNVLEWCWDWSGNYTADAQTNPTGPSSGSYRMHRGGSYGVLSDATRSVCRDSPYPPFRRYEFLGFRLARSSN